MVPAMSCDRTITELRRRADAIRGFGARSLFLYGSVARGAAGRTSDVDLFIDAEPASRFSLVELAGLKLYLEHELRVEVDLTTRDSLHPLLRAEIEQSAIRVF